MKVGGNLTLAGTLNATAGSAGYYQLYQYGGTLSGSYDTVNVTGVSGGTGTVQTGIPGQVNLFVAGTGQVIQFWDGADATGNGTVDGGTGTWSSTGTNWTGAPGAAGINGPYEKSVAVFSGTAGTVTVDGTQDFDTLQFKTDGYVAERRHAQHRSRLGHDRHDQCRCGCLDRDRHRRLPGPATWRRSARERSSFRAATPIPATRS